jgi:biopolymer transport protein ExbD
MRRRTKRKRSQAEVELNLAAMLDMAFQLLAFFILTFKPSPVEGQIDLRLPPPRPVTNTESGRSPGADEQNTDPLQGLNTLVITVLGNKAGEIDGLLIGEGPAPSVPALEARVRDILSDPANSFDQVIIQVGSTLRYEHLMKIVDICTNVRMADGGMLSKLSFVELPTAP